MTIQIYSSEELKALRSEYLDHGYKQDQIVIRHVESGESEAKSIIDIADYYMPGDGQYHFTSIHAMIVVSQVGIILASRANGFSAKPDEIYMRDFTIVCRRKINKTAGIEMTMKLQHATLARDHMLYDIAYQFDNDAFTGTLRCLFPVAFSVLRRHKGAEISSEHRETA